MVETPDFREWVRDEVRCSSGERVGTLEDVYYEADSGEPVFLLVKSGFLGRRLTFIPTEGVKPGRAYLMVAHDEHVIKNAPTLEPGTAPSPETEERLYTYYKMDYQPHASGHRLVRR